MRIGTIVASVTLGIAVALPASAVAQERGTVGGAPSLGPPLSKREGPTSEAIVIGTGTGPQGRVEIVAQNSKLGLCIFIDHPDQESSSGNCGTRVVPSTIGVLEETFTGAKRRANAVSAYSGFMQPTASTVVGVAAQRKKRSKRVRRKTGAGIAAAPGPDILSRLHQSQPFGFFALEFRGCLIHAKVRVTAIDASGLFLASDLAFRPHAKPEEIGGFRFVPCGPGTLFDEVRFAPSGIGVASARPGPTRSGASPGSGSRSAIGRSR
jgi:hypothetical protein